MVKCAKKENCPYEGVVGKTALTFDASAIVFSVVNDIQSRLVHLLRIPAASQLCIQPPSPLPMPGRPAVSSKKCEKI
jgi:hypothetical protein